MGPWSTSAQLRPIPTRKRRTRTRGVSSDTWLFMMRISDKHADTCTCVRFVTSKNNLNTYTCRRILYMHTHIHTYIYHGNSHTCSLISGSILISPMPHKRRPNGCSHIYTPREIVFMYYIERVFTYIEIEHVFTYIHMMTLYCTHIHI